MVFRVLFHLLHGMENDSRYIIRIVHTCIRDCIFGIKRISLEWRFSLLNSLYNADNYAHQCCHVLIYLDVFSCFFLHFFIYVALIFQLIAGSLFTFSLYSFHIGCSFCLNQHVLYLVITRVLQKDEMCFSLHRCKAHCKSVVNQELLKHTKNVETCKNMYVLVYFFPTSYL